MNEQKSAVYSCQRCVFIAAVFQSPKPFQRQKVSAAECHIYGMNGVEILLQMPTSTHGLTSLAKITGIWQNMLPVCLSIGGLNVCSPGILLALDVWAVHETPGIQNLMRTAYMRILDIGEMRHWTTAYGTHILIRL